jgi:hypothetical protein
MVQLSSMMKIAKLIVDYTNLILGLLLPANLQVANI